MRLHASALRVGVPQPLPEPALRKKRAYEIDTEHCPNCGDRLSIIAAIEQLHVIRKIRAQLGLPARRHALELHQSETMQVDAGANAYRERGIFSRQRVVGRFLDWRFCHRQGKRWFEFPIRDHVPLQTARTADASHNALCNFCKGEQTFADSVLYCPDYTTLFAGLP